MEQKQTWSAKVRRPTYSPGDFVQVIDKETGFPRFVEWMPEQRRVPVGVGQ